MCFNTLLKCIDQDKVKLIGYSYCNTLQPLHCFQFADDSAITTATTEDSQALVNVFTEWCHWAEFIVRVEKYLPVGIKKYGKTDTQFKSFPKVNNKVIL